MRPKSLKNRMLLSVIALVLSASLGTCLLVTRQYSASIQDSMRIQAQDLAQAIALECTDKVLTRDLVSLKKLLDYQKVRNPTVSYLFIAWKDKVLAHTFEKGFPEDLFTANHLSTDHGARYQKISSRKGEEFLDIAWPLFHEGYGILRLGLSRAPFQQKIKTLWFKMGLITLGVLLIVSLASLFFVRQLTLPLRALSQVTKKVIHGEWDVRVPLQRDDEVGELAASFNHMLAKMEEYTRKLEEQTAELEFAHHRTQTSCKIVQEIGSMYSVKEISSFLLQEFQKIVKCSHPYLILSNNTRDLLFLASKEGFQTISDDDILRSSLALIDRADAVTHATNSDIGLPFISNDVGAFQKMAILSIRDENQHPVGALVIACPTGCECHPDDLAIAHLVLSHSATVIKRALIQEEEMRELQSRLSVNAEYCGIIGKDRKMQEVYKLIEDIAPTDATVLVQGESGTGKELVAKAIHLKSPRRNKPFVVINCAAYPSTLLESELFGHEKGAFTGALRQRIGRFEQAHGGTVFLDEISEIPLAAQIKLLRVLQTQKFERIGGDQTIGVDVRIIAATNKDLLGEVKSGAFREDLFYRINVIPVGLPPLRDRQNDIPLLAEHFLRRHVSQQGKKILGFTPDAMRLLMNYSWPGNVRELENTVEHCAIIAKGRYVEASDIPSLIRAGANALPSGQGQLLSMEENEKEHIKLVLERCNWNKRLAAKRLKISRNTLYLKLKKYQITPPTFQ